MPYTLQTQREQHNRVSALEELVKKLSAKDEKKEKEESEAPILMGQGRLMIGNGPYVRQVMEQNTADSH
jgi:hypothetical protein